METCSVPFEPHPHPQAHGPAACSVTIPTSPHAMREFGISPGGSAEEEESAEATSWDAVSLHPNPLWGMRSGKTASH